MNSRICLIRHGITEGNKNKLFYGHADIPLAEEGVNELKQLAGSGIYPDGSSAHFYTSGLKRTEQTLELIYGRQKHEVLEGLKELNFGDFEMKSYDELKELEEYKTWRADTEGRLAPPGGESLRAFYKRAVRGFEELKRRHMLNVLECRHSGTEAVSIAVCHGGTISAIMESICPRHEDNFYKWIPDPGHGYVICMKDAEVAAVEKF